MRKKGTREQIHDLVDEVPIDSLDNVLEVLNDLIVFSGYGINLHIDITPKEEINDK